MKLLLLGLFPVLIFWLVEEHYGTFWGLIAAMVWALGECSYEYIRHKKVESITLVSTGLVVVLGGIGAALENSRLFKFQPAILEVVFAAVIWWGGRGGEPVLLKMAKKTRPEIFAGKSELFLQQQKERMVRMSRHMIALLLGHGALMAYLALYGTTGQWAFWKGIGFNVLLLFLVAFEILAIRFSVRR